MTQCSVYLVIYEQSVLLCIEDKHGMTVLMDIGNHRPGKDLMSLENSRQSDIRLFDKDDCVNNWQIPYSATGGRYLAVYTSQYEGNYEKAYIYDLHTEKLTEVQRFYGKAVPAKIGDRIYYLAPASEQRVFLNSGLTERIDYNYIIVSLENLCDGNGNNIKVENQIEYR